MIDQDELNKHTVLVDKKVLALLRGGRNTLHAENAVAPKLESQGDEFYYCDLLKRVEKKDAGEVDALLYGKLFEQYKEATRGEVIVLPSDNASHKCTATCTLINLQGRRFEVPGAPGRLHVCLKGYPCTAPDYFHQGNCTNIGSELYVCKDTCRLHICTPDACDAEKVTTSVHTCCSITGRVLGPSAKQLSHGWIEDEWRAPPTLGPSPRRTPRLKPGDDASTLHALKALLCDPNKQHAATSDLQRQLRQQTKELFPWSPTRKRVERQEMCTRFKSMVHTVEKWARQEVAATRHGEAVNLYRLSCVLPQVAPKQDWWVDESKAHKLSIAYADGVAPYLSVLVQETSVAESEVSTRDAACAILYLLKEPFVLQGNRLILADAVAQHCLPPASQLSSYGYKKTSFTKAKTAVKEAITRAVCKQNKPVSLFAFSAVRVRDILRAGVE